MDSDLEKVKFFGQSMYPFIRDGDEISVNIFNPPQPLDKMAEGQVVLIKLDKEWVVHRLVRYNNISLTKGDGALLADNFFAGAVDKQCEEKHPVVWGQVTAINGHCYSICQSSWIAKLSAMDLYIGFRPMRWTRRVIFLICEKVVKMKIFNSKNGGENV